MITERITPGNELASAMAGAFLASATSGRDSAAARVVRVAGVGLMAAAATSVLRRMLVSTGVRRRMVHIETRFEVGRPIRDVFEFFKDFENLPRAISLVEHVDDTRDGRSVWRARSATGELVTWDMVVSRYLPPTVIGWRNATHSPVDMSGHVRLRATSPDRTTVDLGICYEPSVHSARTAMRGLMLPTMEARLRADLQRLPAYLESLPLTAPRDVA